RQSPVAPQFPNEPPAEVVAKGQEISNTIADKAVSIDQLNRFCHDADLPPPVIPITGTDQQKFEAAKRTVVGEIGQITEPLHMQKAAAAAAAIFGSQPPNH